MPTLKLSDYGLKSLETTGSVEAGSRVLTVASSAGFRVGDSVVVAVGGEEGGGQRGTVGVGGVWDTAKSPWANPNDYYWGAPAPKALSAKIVGISSDGTKLTLDQDASASTIGAQVFYNNKAAWDAAVGSTSSPNVTIEIPAGSFAFSGQLMLGGRVGWTIDGAGKTETRLFSVDGAVPVSMSIYQSDSTVVRDFELSGNAGLQGYGFGSPEIGWLVGGIGFTRSANGVAQDITVRDVWNTAVGSYYSSNIWAHRVDAHLSEGLASYTQWQFQWAESVGGGAVDSSVESPTLVWGFNSFRSSGTSYIRPTMVNAVMAANSSGGFLYEDPKILITENSWVDDRWFSRRENVININSNLDGKSPLLSQGGTVRNAEIVFTDKISPYGDILTGITVGPNNPNITITGGHYAAPDYVAGSYSSGPIGIWSQGSKTVVEDFGVIGSGPNPNIIVNSGTVQHSFAESIWVKSGQAIGNGTPQAITVAVGGKGATPEGYGSYTFTITRSGDALQPLAASYTVVGSGDHPTEPGVFLGGVVPSGIVNFAPGETTKTVAILTQAPFVRGADQQFTFKVGSTTAGAYVLNEGVSASLSSNAAPNGEACIVGTARVGEQLTVDASNLFDADGLGGLHIEWQSSTDGLSWRYTGASAAAYGLGTADEGLMLRAIITYVDGKGLAETVASASTGLVTSPAPPSTGDGSALVWISNGGGNSAHLALPEHGTAVTLAEATDPHGSSLAYSIAGGADAAKFTINAVTGALAFASAPDFEAASDADFDNVYEVLIRATDGTRVIHQALSIAITNVNDVAPTLLPFGGAAAAEATVAENTNSVTTVAATDADGTIPTYAIAGGADAAKFTINSTTGALAFKVAPNFEAPTDAGANNVYDVIVRATDGSRHSDQALAVTVANVNDANPTITSYGGRSSASVTVAENTKAVTTVAATDADGTIPTYAIGGGADAAKFTINAVTGALSFVSAPNYEAPTDANQNNVYDVVVRATDGTRISDQTLAVAVTNVNDGGSSDDKFVFGGSAFKLGAFGAEAEGGGWSSHDRYPRVLADVNGDGMADIVGFASAGAIVSLATGNGDFGGSVHKLGGFGTGAGAGGWSSDDRYPRLLGDVNGDGMADIVGFASSGVVVSLATGGGDFSGSAFKLGAFGAGAEGGRWISDDLYARLLGDVDGDGMADIVGFASSGVVVSLATGGGDFGGSVLKLGAFGVGPEGGGWSSQDRYPRLLGDVNGDGLDDIVGFASSGVVVSLATGGGNFGGSMLKLGAFGAGLDGGGWNSNTLYHRELADVNGDGMDDIVGFSDRGVMISLATGGGNFGEPVCDVAAFGPGAGGWTSQTEFPRHLADVNGDGAADIVGFGSAGVYEALSSGHFLV